MKVMERLNRPKPTTKTMNFTFMPPRIMTMMSKERLDSLGKVWEEYEDGLTISEFVQLMLNHVMCQSDDEKYELIYGSFKLFLEVDINGDGRMDWSEFMQYIIDAVSASAIKGGEG